MPQGAIDIHFADGVYDFALPLPQIEELQQKTGAGIGALFARLLKGVVETETGTYVMPSDAAFYANDIVETIRLALIGGGKGIVNGQEVRVTAVTAAQLVDRYVAPPRNALKDNWALAAGILGACVVGYDPPKKGGPASERAATATPTDDLITP